MAADTCTKGINLDEVVEEFTVWHRHYEEVSHEKLRLENEMKILQKQYESSCERQAATVEDLKQAQAMVSQLQQMLKVNCDLKDENNQLTDRVTNILEELAAVKEEHKLALQEAEKKMETLKLSHKEEIENVQEAATEQREREVGLLKEGLQQKAGEVCQLQKQLASQERDKHTELARLRLEYDAKLLKLQKETSRAQQQKTQTANKGNDIFRQKLLNVRSEADREISSLKRTVSDLQRKLDAQTAATFGPKRKF